MSYESFDEYKQNIDFVSKSYVGLSLIEVCLRNKINNYFVKFDSNWLENKDHVGGGFFLVEKAKKSLKKYDKIISNNSLVPELTLGFWVGIFSPHKTGFSLDNKHMKKMFNKNDIIKKDELYAILKNINDFRNRAFHHEKIINIDRFLVIEQQIQQILLLLDNDLLDLVEDIKKLK
jgi:hypothetical protein